MKKNFVALLRWLGIEHPSPAALEGVDPVKLGRLPARWQAEVVWACCPHGRPRWRGR